jgi:membrane-associated phospholipid phosphatase
MHVAQAFLFFLAMRKISRSAGICFGIFAVVVAVSSVHLGYHYAIDGYVSLVVTMIVWALSGKLARLTDARHQAGTSRGRIRTSPLSSPPIESRK